MLKLDFVPVKPFPDFKWKWASLQCTEGINDPVVLLGVLSRMRKLEKEGRGIKYSSPEFAKEMEDLSNDIKGAVDVRLSTRTGERNLIRNSGQYWKAVGLIPAKDSHSGIIDLTDFGRKVADHEISQSEFAVKVIQSLTLPNPAIQRPEECRLWNDNGLNFHPLLLLLRILLDLYDYDHSYAYLTNEEFLRIVIPLSGCRAELQDYHNFILQFRAHRIMLENWPDCTSKDNDQRFAREYFLFLSNYGYVDIEGESRTREIYHINQLIVEEIRAIASETSFAPMSDTGINDVASEMERKRVSFSVSRPRQAAFRKVVLESCKRCIITNVTMPEVLEAAHIKPYKYKGEDTVANGFAMRVDIHTLFDTGHLRISPDGDVELSGRARLDYGALIPPKIVIPDFTDKENIRWRWDNYNGI